jgi:hypothetical protein
MTREESSLRRFPVGKMFRISHKRKVVVDVDNDN